MPASVNESISASLQLSMWSSHGHSKAAKSVDEGAAVQQRLASVAKMVPDIAFETSNDSYYKSVLQTLKTKYSETSGPAAAGGAANGHADNVLGQPTLTLFPPERVNLHWPEKNNKVGSGFSNAGNTCYLNSVLQALFHIPPLCNWLLYGDHEHQSSCATFRNMGQECIVCCMAITLKTSINRTGDSTRPGLILNKLRTICKRLQVGHQEDAMEFLRYLLESMEKSYLHRHNSLKLDIRSKETTPLNQIFGGYIRTEVTCISCHSVSTTFQHFLDLTLDITRAFSLDNALDNYFSQERLEDNSYRCDRCKKKVPATKQFFVERPPNVLCIQLKRFSIDGKKIGKKIMLNDRIHLHKYKPRVNGCHQRGASYRLIAGVNHLGHSAHSGHYTTLAYASNNNMYIFDDTCVQLQHQKQFSGSDVYVLMYVLEPKKQLEDLSQQAASSSQPARLPSTAAIPKLPFLPNKLLQSPKTAIIFNQNRKILPSPIPAASMANKLVTSPAKKVINSANTIKVEMTNGNSSQPASGNISRPSSNSVSQPSPKLIGPSMPSLVPYQTDHSSDDDTEENSIPPKLEASQSLKLAVGANEESKGNVRPVSEKQPMTNGTGQPPASLVMQTQPSPKKEYSVKSTTLSWNVSSADKTPPSQTTSKLSTNSKWVVTEAARLLKKKEEDKPNESLKRKHDSLEGEEMEWIEKPKDSSRIQSNGVSTNVSSSTVFSSAKRQDQYGPLPPGTLPAGLTRNGLNGYGTEVKSWNGTKSMVDKQISEGFWMAKRDKDASCDYDEEIDGGKRKKAKRSSEDNYNNKPNGFQQFANWKNSNRHSERDYHYSKPYDRRNNKHYDDHRVHKQSHHWQQQRNHRPYDNHKRSDYQKRPSHHNNNNNRYNNNKWNNNYRRN